MLEAEYKKQIREGLTEAGAKVIPIITGEMTNKGEPDIIGSYLGRCFVIEAKIAPKEPEIIQEHRLEEWAKAGAVAISPAYPTQDSTDILNFIRFVIDPDNHIINYENYESWQVYFKWWVRTIG